MHQHLFGANLQEMMLLQIPVLQDIGGLAAACLFQMTLQQASLSWFIQ